MELEQTYDLYKAGSLPDLTPRQHAVMQAYEMFLDGGQALPNVSGGVIVKHHLRDLWVIANRE